MNKSVEYQKGLKWAEEQLSKGLSSENDIAAQCDLSGIDPTDFDRGANEAIRRFRKDV